MTRKLLLVMVLAVFSLLSGCGSVERKPAVPADLTTKAVVPGMPDVRYRVGIDTDSLRRDAVASFWREMATLGIDPHKDALPPANFLVISGGGDQGAFGAGLLNGWADAGTRPDFKLVTGVSTGALTAPFAFLGAAGDQRLRSLYTTLSSDDIVEPRSILAALTSDAMADNAPLWRLVEREVDQSMPGRRCSGT
jgi:hypothetical protein